MLRPEVRELPITQPQGLARGVDLRLTSSGERYIGVREELQHAAERTQAIEEDVCMEESDMPPLIRVSDGITASSVDRSIGGLIIFLGSNARHNNYLADLLSRRMGREETDSDIEVEVEVGLLEWRRRRKARRNSAF